MFSEAANRRTKGKAKETNFPRVTHAMKHLLSNPIYPCSAMLGHRGEAGLAVAVSLTALAFAALGAFWTAGESFLHAQLQKAFGRYIDILLPCWVVACVVVLLSSALVTWRQSQRQSRVVAALQACRGKVQAAVNANVR